jgi:hypothetical protein
MSFRLSCCKLFGVLMHIIYSLMDELGYKQATKKYESTGARSSRLLPLINDLESSCLPAMFPSAIRAVARPTAARLAAPSAFRSASAAAPSVGAASGAGQKVDPYAHKSLFWKMMNPENNTLRLQREFQAERAMGIPTHLMGRGKYYVSPEVVAVEGEGMGRKRRKQEQRAS